MTAFAGTVFDVNTSPFAAAAAATAAAQEMEYREAMLKRTVAVIRSCRLPPDQAFEVRVAGLISPGG